MKGEVQDLEAGEEREGEFQLGGLATWTEQKAKAGEWDQEKSVSSSFQSSSIRGREKLLRSKAAQDSIRRVEELKKKHNKEILKILEEENTRESERDQKLESVSDPNERKRLDKILAAERAKAQQKIQTTMK